jgi:hypothetical protein
LSSSYYEHYTSKYGIYSFIFLLSANSSNPSGISKNRQISDLTSAQNLSSSTIVLLSMQAGRQFPALTSAQSFSSFTNVLPSMQADHQFSALTNAQSFSSFTNVLPSMQVDRQFPALTNAQSFSSFTNVLPSMQVDRQFPALTNAQSFSSFTNVLPSMQAENCLLDHRFMVVFRCGQNMALCSCARFLQSAALADVSNFRLSVLLLYSGGRVNRTER